ncbi:hypothetical protein VNO77_42166 [Canavalia gladiata]|uniref:Uncharacterized protein n=1 Tax=Canavalia gladiata TaxID=3824 RepID=A0AAN9PSL2_CANGL
MSELRDMWTKLKEKGNIIFSRSGSNPIHHESSHQGIQQKEKSSTVVGQHSQVLMPRLMYSEASVSMLVECFNA